MEQLALASVGRGGTWGRGWREDGPKQVDRGLGNALADWLLDGNPHIATALLIFWPC